MKNLIIKIVSVSMILLVSSQVYSNKLKYQKYKAKESVILTDFPSKSEKAILFSLTENKYLKDTFAIKNKDLKVDLPDTKSKSYYRLVLIDTKGNHDVQDGYFVVDPTLSKKSENISESSLLENEITIYPNPVSHTLRFTSEVEHYKVFDIKGVCLIESNQRSKSVQVLDIPIGMYYIVYNTNGKKYASPFFKTE
ncbi:MAG: hypothetical protein Kapaf2KO_23860 [Candidatus Kapaibacteriales bacterium]